MATIAINKRATFDYEILEKYEAGLMLIGAEVKSIKSGRISLKESFVTIKGSELYLTNANIPKYAFAGNLPSYEPTRPRKLLVKKSESKSLIGKARTQGLTLIPLRVYTKKRLVKLEFALARGKKAYDKRSDMAKKDAKKKIERALKKR